MAIEEEEHSDGREEGPTGQEAGSSAAPDASQRPAGTAQPAGTSGSASPAETARSGLGPWWIRWPDRLQFEISELAAAGIKVEVDGTAQAAGVIVLNLTGVKVGEETLILRVTFPDLFPEYRFEISAPDLELPKHQHPESHFLCLLGRSSSNWNVSDTVAKFISERIPLVLQSARGLEGDHGVDAIEEHQGEPFATYFPSHPDSAVVLDSEIKLSGNRGSMQLACAPFGRRDPFRGQARLVRNRDSGVLYQTTAVSSAFSESLEARWVVLPETPTAASIESLLDAAFTVDKTLRKPVWRSLSGLLVDVIGVAFTQEVGYRRYGLGWVFAIRIQGKKTGSVEGYLVRSANAGRADLRERIPAVSYLSDHKIAIVGLGTLGAPSAFEFARAGIGTLHLLDGDFIEPSGGVRWPLGMSAAGLGKTRSVHEFCSANYPLVKIAAWRQRLGATRNLDVRSDPEVLEEFLDGVSLIFDASAERGVHLVLSRLSQERIIPYMTIAGTPGAWGGSVARFIPGKSGCWQCLQRHVTEGTIPAPPFDPDGNVQPTGCADPTFTGVGFDMSEVSLTGVRLAVSTLSTGLTGAYPKTEWDVGVLSLRNEDGGLIPPTWQTYQLSRHSECTACHAS